MQSKFNIRPFGILTSAIEVNKVGFVSYIFTWILTVVCLLAFSFIGVREIDLNVQDHSTLFLFASGSIFTIVALTIFTVSNRTRKS